MSKEIRKLKLKQYRLEKRRRDLKALNESLTHRLRIDAQTYRDCVDIPICPPVSAVVFRRLMDMRLDELEGLRNEILLVRENLVMSLSTPNFI